MVCTLIAIDLLHDECVTALQLVDLADSALSGKIQHIPDNMYDLDADWEIDPKALTLMEKIGDCTTKALPLHRRLEQGAPIVSIGLFCSLQKSLSRLQASCNSRLSQPCWGAGEGEFGIVHKAMFHGTLVAAKILKGSSAIALGDFRSEIEVLRKVHHPNAVQFLGACTKQEPYILVTGAYPPTPSPDLWQALQWQLDMAPDWHGCLRIFLIFQGLYPVLSCFLVMPGPEQHARLNEISVKQRDRRQAESRVHVLQS